MIAQGESAETLPRWPSLLLPNMRTNTMAKKAATTAKKQPATGRTGSASKDKVQAYADTNGLPPKWSVQLHMEAAERQPLRISHFETREQWVSVTVKVYASIADSLGAQALNNETFKVIKDLGRTVTASACRAYKSIAGLKTTGEKREAAERVFKTDLSLHETLDDGEEAGSVKIAMQPDEWEFIKNLAVDLEVSALAIVRAELWNFHFARKRKAAEFARHVANFTDVPQPQWPLSYQIPIELSVEDQNAWFTAAAANNMASCEWGRAVLIQASRRKGGAATVTAHTLPEGPSRLSVMITQAEAVMIDAKAAKQGLSMKQWAYAMLRAAWVPKGGVA